MGAVMIVGPGLKVYRLYEGPYGGYTLEDHYIFNLSLTLAACIACAVPISDLVPASQCRAKNST